MRQIWRVLHSEAISQSLPAKHKWRDRIANVGEAWTLVFEKAGEGIHFLALTRPRARTYGSRMALVGHSLQFMFVNLRAVSFRLSVLKATRD